MIRSMLRRIAAAAVVAAVAFGASARRSEPAEAQRQAGVQDTVSTAVGTVLGATIGRIVGEFEQAGVVLDRDVVADVAARAIRGTGTGMTPEQAQDVVNGILATMKPLSGVDSFDTASQERFLDEAAARPGAVRTPSGVVVEVMVEGEGPMPSVADRVRLNYVGRLSDDTVFDATDDPVVFAVGELTPGLSEALTMMRPGGKYRVTIPASGAYGEEGIPGVIPGRAALQFKVELIEVLDGK